MVRVLVNPSRGVHPAYPDAPEPLPGNRAIGTVPLFGVALGLLSGTTSRFLRRRPFFPTFLRHTGRWSIAIVCAEGAHQWTSYNWETKPFLTEMGVKLKPWTVLQMSSKPTMDDFAFVGMAAGCLLALPRGASRLSEAGPPSRILGAMAVGSLAGVLLFPLLYHNRFMEAYTKFVDSYERATLVRLQLETSQRWKPFFGSRGFPVAQIQQMAPLSSQSGAIMTAPAQEELIPQLPSPHPALPPPGSEPHAVAIVNGEVRPWPNTDYFWNPGSRDDGIKKLQEHIKKLQETRKELAIEAEYLWIVIAKKEHLYYTENDEDKKTILRKELELLGDIHSKMFQDISGYDWMIADSKKNILQLKNDKWIPEPRTPEVPKHSPERSLRLIRNHLNHMKEAVKANDQNLFPDDTPEELKDHIEKQLEFLKQNMDATASLVREFENYVQEGRDQARADYLKSKEDGEEASTQ